MDILINSGVFFTIGFMAGAASGVSFIKWLSSQTIKNQFYNIDSKASIQNIIVILITLVWLVTTLIGAVTGKPIDVNIHWIMGGMIGAYFGTNIFKKDEKNSK